MSDIVRVLVSLSASLLTVLGSYAAWRVKSWLDDKKLSGLIADAVEAAEQTLKDKDPTGAGRKERVISQLCAAGYELSEWLDTRIEAAVYKINQI